MADEDGNVQCGIKCILRVVSTTSHGYYAVS
jgi:hypothetical protein